MSWFYLLVAILCEVAGTTCMKLSAGFTRWLPASLMLAFYLLSLGLLTFALRGIPMSIAYAVWAGVGTALVAVIGVVAFHETLTTTKAVCLLLIIGGVIGLNLAGAAH